LMTCRMATFHSCLTVASCTTIPARVKRTPATKNIESSSDMKQALN
jgi:starvation-inducible outer membrane lipoprotein